MKEQVYCFLSPYGENSDVLSKEHRYLLRSVDGKLLIMRADSDEIDRLNELLKDKYIGGIFIDGSQRVRNTASIGMFGINNLTEKMKVVESAGDFMSEIHDRGMTTPTPREANKSTTR